MSNSKGQKKIKEIEVSGTPYEMGLQYGSACPEIREMFNVTCQALGLGGDAAISSAEIFIPFTQAYAPDIVDEMKGIAEGAKVDFRQVVFLNSFDEISASVSATSLSAKCTSFAAGGEATSNGEVIMGQQLDCPPAWEDLTVLLKIRPSEGPNILTVVPVGMVGMVTLNSAGLALSGNSVIHKDFILPKGGVPVTSVVRKALSSENIGKAIGAIASARRGYPVNLLLGSHEGDIVDIEVMPNDLGFLYPERGFLTHANHFETSRFKGGDLMASLYPDSYVRSHRLATLMGKHWGKLSVDVMKELLQDHNNYPDSICRHTDQKAPPILQWKTVVSVISYPKEQKMHIALGNPCENEYIEYEL